ATLQNSTIIYYTSCFLIFINIIWTIITSGIVRSKYLLWLTMVVFLVLASSFWAFDRNYAFEGIKTIFVTYLIFILLLLFVKCETDFYNILKIFILTQIMNILFIFYNLDLSSLGESRIGSAELGGDWNANRIGLLMSFAGFSSFVLIFKENNILKKYMLFLLVLLFGTVSLLTGSKKALFILIFSVAFFYTIYSKSNKLTKIIAIALYVFLFYYMIMNVPMLYEALGSRVDEFILTSTGQSTLDKSSQIRFSLVQYGVEIFKDRPLLGHGINNFRPLYGHLTGWYTYSHNNYIEMLVGLGIIGTIIYYSMYIYILVKTFKVKTILSIFAFVSIIAILITEIGLVSYTSFYIQLFICLSFLAVKIQQGNRRG